MDAPLPALLTPHRRRWLMSLLANGLARALMAASGLVLLRWALSDGPAPLPALWLLPALMGGVLVQAWLQRREMLDAEALAQHYIAHVRMRLFDRLATLTPDHAQRRSRGGVLLRFIGDVQALRSWVGRGMARGVVAGSTLAALWLLLLATAPALGAAAVLILALAAAAMWRLWPAMYGATSAARRRQALVAAHMQDRIAGLATLQSFGRLAAERKRLNRLNVRLRRSLQTRAGWRGHHRALSTLASGALLACLAAQAVLTSPGPGAAASAAGSASAWLGLTAGSSLLVMLMLPAIRTLGQVADAWVSARVARARLAGVLAGQPQPVAGSHPVGEQPVLVLQRPSWTGRVDGPELVVHPGARVAISGPPGAGKTSLLMLMAGLQAPSAGAVRLDDRSLAELDPASLRRKVALLSPDLPLLRGTTKPSPGPCGCPGWGRCCPGLPTGCRPACATLA